MAEEQPVNWQERYQQLEGQYRQDLERAYNALTQASQQQPQAPPPEEPQWDTSDPAKLREQVEGSLRKTVSETLAPVVTTLAGNQFESNMSILRGDARFPHFQQWEGEIRQLAGQVAPGLLSKLDTIANIYGLVAMRHQNELIDEEVKRRMTAQAEETPPEGEVEIEGEDEEPEVTTPAPAPAPQPRPQPQQAARPAAQQMGGMQPSRSTRAPGRIRLTREEVYIAERMGMTPMEYAKAKNLGDVEI